MHRDILKKKISNDYKIMAESNVVIIIIEFEDYEGVLSDCLKLYSKDFASMLARTSFFHAFEIDTLDKLTS